MQLMELLRRHLESGVDARGVVDMEESVDLVDEFPQRFESPRITEIHLELIVEGFLIPVLPRASCMTHGLRDAEEVAEHLHVSGCVLAPSVTMENLRRGMLMNAGEERIDDELDAVIGEYGESSDSSCEEIHHRTEVESGVLPVYMREIRGPDVIRIRRFDLHKEIGDDIFRFLLRLFPFSPPPTVGLNPEEFHHPERPFLVHPEVQSKPPVPIAWVDAQNLLDCALERPVLRWLPWNVVERCPGNAEHLRKLCLAFLPHDQFFFWA